MTMRVRILKRIICDVGSKEDELDKGKKDTNVGRPRIKGAITWLFNKVT